MMRGKRSVARSMVIFAPASCDATAVICVNTCKSEQICRAAIPRQRRNAILQLESVHERGTSRAENLSDAAAGWAHRRALSHRRRRRKIASILRKGLRRPHSEQRRQNGAPGYIQIANTWLLVNPGGGPTPDKPTVTLSVPADPDKVSSFVNIRVADIQACYKLWRSRGAEFITEPKPKYGQTRCYIRDPDGYIIEVGGKATRASLTAKKPGLRKCCHYSLESYQ